MTAATVLLAAALLVPAGRPGAARLRGLAATRPGRGGAAPDEGVRGPWLVVGGAAAGALSWALTGSAVVAAAVAALSLGAGPVLRRSARPAAPDDDPAELAWAWEQLAVCLEAGLPVAAAVDAAAEPLDGRAGATLRRVAGLLALGADPTQAWDAAGTTPSVGAFARAAARSATTGAALARAARTEAGRLRAALADGAEARAQRAAVLITGPLGLCHLPAFLALGIAPVVIGLAGEVLAQW